MNLLSTRSTTGKIVFVLASVMIIFCLASCARKISFDNSSVVPAARGTAKIKKDKNQNYNIEVSLSDLAEPGRLTPAKKTYVVWMESENNAAKNIGHIGTATGFLSNKLRSSFHTVSSNKPTKIFLTAEDDGDIQFPGMPVILTTSNF